MRMQNRFSSVSSFSPSTYCLVGIGSWLVLGAGSTVFWHLVFLIVTFRSFLVLLLFLLLSPLLPVPALVWLTWLCQNPLDCHTSPEIWWRLWILCCGCCILLLIYYNLCIICISLNFSLHFLHSRRLPLVLCGFLNMKIFLEFHILPPIWLRWLSWVW